MMDVKMPDGTVIKNVPDHYSQEDLLSQYQQMSKPSEEKQAEAPKAITPPFADFAHSDAAKYLAPIASAGVGLAKPFAGAAELLGMGAPARYLNQASEQLNKVGGTPSQVAELGGELLSPMPTKVLGLAAKGVKYAPQIASAGSELLSHSPAAMARAAQALQDLYKGSALTRGAVQGAQAAALNPVGGPEGQSYTDLLAKKAEQIPGAVAAGAGLSKLGQVAMNPKVSEEVQKLKDLGMKYFTPGQLAGQVPMLGKLIQGIEQKATSIPLAGNIVEHGLKVSAGDFNRALGNEVLKPMGETLPSNIKPGKDLIAYLNDRIESAYDKITPKLSLTNQVYKAPDTEAGFTTTVKVFNDKLADITQGLPMHEAELVQKEFDRHILTPLYKMSLDGGKMSGEDFRRAEKNLGQTAFSFMKDGKTYEIGAALKELQGELRQELANQNPALAKELNGIHQAFIRHLPVERAAGMLGSEGRIFAPSQLESAIKATTKGKGNFASGRATFYPESQAALNVMGKSIPDSGTAGRMQLRDIASLMAAPAGAVAAPHMLTPLAPLAAIYNKPVMGALTKLATERPEFMKRAAPAVESGLGTLGGYAASNPSAPNQ